MILEIIARYLQIVSKHLSVSNDVQLCSTCHFCCGCLVYHDWTYLHERLFVLWRLFPQHEGVVRGRGIRLGRSLLLLLLPLTLMFFRLLINPPVLAPADQDQSKQEKNA